MTWTCGTCQRPIRPLDGAQSGSDLPDGWHHGADASYCEKAAATDYGACFDIAWHFLASAKMAYDRFLQASMDEHKTWTWAELDALLAPVQNALWEGVEWGYYPRHGKPPILRWRIMRLPQANEDRPAQPVPPLADEQAAAARAGAGPGPGGGLERRP